MTQVEKIEDAVVWHGRACSILQVFRIISPARLNLECFVQRLDARVNDRTRAAGLGLLRWHDGGLMLGPLCVLRLGALRQHPIAGFEAAAGRKVLGGLIAREGGATLWYGARREADNLIAAAGLSDFAPRLPRLPFSLVQSPLHRRIIRRAVISVAG